MVKWWAFEILTSVAFGYQFITLLTSNQWELLIRVGAAIPIGLITFSWFFFIISFFSPMKLIHGVMVIILFTILTILLHFINLKQKPTMLIRFDYFQKWTFILSGFLLTVVFYASMLMDGTSSKGAAYSDLPFHLNLISSFSHGRNYIRNTLFDSWTPFISDEPLVYPMIVDFHSAALISTGSATLQKSLFLPSLLMSFSLIISLYYLSRYYISNRIGASISVLLFIGLGGLGFTVAFDSSAKQTGFSDFIHYWSDDIHEFWLQSLMHIIVPQRSALFAMPLCYFSIFAIILGIQKSDIKMMFIAGIMTGLTPQVQAHAYVSMAQWAFSFCVVTFPYFGNKKKKLKSILLWATFAITANLLAVPQLFVYFGRLKNNKESFVKFDPVWNTPPKRGVKYAPIVLWWRGLGVFGVIALIFGWFTATKKQIQVYIPSVVVFVIGNLIRYQLWEMDNIKVFYDGWIPIAVPFVAQFIVFFIKHGNKNRKRETLNGFIAFFLVTTSVLSGFLCILTVLSAPAPIFQGNDISFGNWISENTNTNDVFLTTQKTGQPVATIGGRELFIGFVGWVVSHGISSHEHVKNIDYLLKHPNDIERFNHFRIYYVVEEFPSFNFSCSENSKIWEIVYSDESRRVWKRNK